MEKYHGFKFQTFSRKRCPEWTPHQSTISILEEEEEEA